MTDHPRFEPVRSVPDQAHLGYHGGRLVGSVLRLADWWRAMRAARRAGGFDVFQHAPGRAAFTKSIAALPMTRQGASSE